MIPLYYVIRSTTQNVLHCVIVTEGVIHVRERKQGDGHPRSVPAAVRGSDDLPLLLPADVHRTRGTDRRAADSLAQQQEAALPFPYSVGGQAADGNLRRRDRDRPGAGVPVRPVLERVL